MVWISMDANGAEGVDERDVAAAVLKVMEQSVEESRDDVAEGGGSWVEGAGLEFEGAPGVYVQVYRELEEEFDGDRNFIGVRPGYTLTVFDGDDQECETFFGDRQGEWPDIAARAARLVVSRLAEPA